MIFCLQKALRALIGARVLKGTNTVCFFLSYFQDKEGCRDIEIVKLYYNSDYQASMFTVKGELML